MNRRTFLAACGLTPAVVSHTALAPLPPAVGGLNIDGILEALYGLQTRRGSQYIDMQVHPDNIPMLQAWWGQKSFPSYYHTPEYEEVISQIMAEGRP